VVKESIDFFMNNQGDKPVDYFHKRLGNVMWEKCGMARNKQGLEEAIVEIKAIRDEFWKEVRVPGVQNSFNQELEKAGRVADFIELGDLMCRDALNREESCGGHFREEHKILHGSRHHDTSNHLIR
jgi:succinate dehydrogenase / fumarate reductase flavoprotein subunit